MTRRVIALALWAYFGWYLAATLASMAALPTAVAPVGGVIVGALALVDWRRRLHLPAQHRDRAPAVSE